jgi:integrase
MKTILTDRLLASLRPAEPGKRRVIWDTALPSFGVRVTDRGVRSFFVMRRMPGKKQPDKVTLKPPYPWLKLADARKLGGEVLSDIAAGIHPKQRARQVAEQKAAAERAERAREANSFASVAEQFIERHVSRKKTARAIEQLVRRELIARWERRPIAEIGRRDVIYMLEEIAAASPSAARQAWIYTQRLFRWALNRDAYELMASPCDRVSITDLIGSPKARERVLDPSELQAIWQVTEAGEYPFDPFVRLLIVLGCRRGELAGMRHDEVDLVGGVWHLPGDRTKNERPRTVPLPEQAVAILNSLPTFSGPYVFTTTSGNRPISGFTKLKERLDRRLAEKSPPGIIPWTLHDIRRTMRTHLSALPISGTVAELMIGHKQRGIRAVYDRYQYLEEQRAGFELWAARLRDIVEPVPKNVTTLRRVG